MGGRVLRLVRNQPVQFCQDSFGLRIRQRLTQIELRIVALLVRGYKNREMALQLGSTEQGIKNSLRKIFDKTGVFDRLELALFVLHHRIVVGAEPYAHRASALGALAAVHSARELEYQLTVN